MEFPTTCINLMGFWLMHFIHQKGEKRLQLVLQSALINFSSLFSAGRFLGNKMRNLVSPWNVLIPFLVSIYAIPTPTPTSTSEEDISTVSSNLTESVSNVDQNLSDITIAKTISERTGKALGVPSDFTKHFNMSDKPGSEKDDSGPAQLNAGPAPDIDNKEEDDHPGSEVQLTESLGLVNGSDGNDSLSDAYAKPVEAVEPRLLYVAPEPTVKSPEDKVIQKIFGGVCTLEVWNHCSKITFWGGDYLVPDKNNPGRMLKRHHKIRCQDPTETNLCLRNGWTVARCHMLCMSQCNLDFRLNYDKLVSHEGDCKMPLLL